MSTNQGFNAEQGAFTAAVKGFDACSAGLVSTMSQLEGALVATLLNRSHYDGAQAVAFAQTHDDIQANMRGATKELANMSWQIHTSFSQYSSGDTEVAGNIKSLNGLISQFPTGRILNGLS